MKYALNLAEDGRVLSVTFEEYAPEDAVTVEELPDGDVSEYRYVDGEFIYDPMSKPSAVPVAPRNIVEGEYITIDGVFYKAITNIPNGGAVIEGQNVVVTTIEEQLYELTKG